MRKIGLALLRCGFCMLKSDSKHVLTIRRWVEVLVIDLNLCPFAARVLAQDSWRLRAIHGDVNSCLTEVAMECQYLENAVNIDTSLLVLPRGYDRFTAYLDLLDMAERMLRELNYSGVFQLASFHPEYQFDSAEEDAIENYTNRSPLPVLQILRESSVTRALTNYNMPESIPVRNKVTLQTLGLQEIKQRLCDISHPK